VKQQVNNIRDLCECTASAAKRNFTKGNHRIESPTILFLNSFVSIHESIFLVVLLLFLDMLSMAAAATASL
jgi:hypothetical protein